MSKKTWLKALSIGLAAVMVVVTFGSTATADAAGNRARISLVKITWQALLDATKNVTGITDQGIHDALKNGKSLADIIQATGGNLDAIVARAKASVRSQLDNLVSQHQLTSKHETQLLAHLDQLVDKLVHRQLHSHRKSSLTATATPAAPTPVK